MKKLLLLSAITTTFLTTTTFALETNVKGFLALDMAVLKQVTKRHTALSTGIGVLDLKFFAEHENLSSKIKLDLDDTKLSDPYNLFEEATVSYKPTKDLKFTAGKGVVPFHRLHWGALEHTYIDSGSALPYPSVDLYWKDIDNKLITSVRYNNSVYKFNNAFTFWGDSKQLSRNADGSYSYDQNGRPYYENSKTFSTDHEWGLANKLEIYPLKGFEVSLSGVVYSQDLNPDTNWALDSGFGYETDKLEIWFETMYGQSSQSRNYQTYYDKDLKATVNPSIFKKRENTYQLGAEVYLTDLMNYVVNSEYAIIKNNLWSKVKNENKAAKFDNAIKFKIAKAAHIATGVMYEKMWKDEAGVKSTVNALEVAAKLSFWF